MQELSKRYETLCQVLAIRNPRTDYRLALWLRLASPNHHMMSDLCMHCLNSTRTIVSIVVPDSVSLRTHAGVWSF